MMRSALLFPPLLLLGLAAASVCAAQSPSAAPPEAWRYTGGRYPDPVLPPPALYSGEGRARLVVDAIVYDPATPSASRAVVRIEGDAGSRRVIRGGDRVGRFRIREIRPRALVAEVRSLGSLREEIVPVGSHRRLGPLPRS